MATMVVLVLAFMFSVSGSIINTSSQTQLKNIVNDNASEIEYDDGYLDYDDIEFYKNQVTTLVYSQDGYLLAGNIQNINSFNAQLKSGEVSSIKIGADDFLIYDILVDMKNYDDVFIRGIISTSEASQMINQVFRMAFFALPLFVLFAGLGSYFICKKSLAPLDTIIETAENISDSSDLSLRINLEKSDAEILKLATTFDKMFDKLECSFLAEKQFTSDVSHELRTPTSVILAECEFYKNEQLTEIEKDESIEVINRQADKMKRLINHLLNLIRLENGMSKVEFEQVDLSELVLMVCDEKRNLLPENIDLRINVQDNIFQKLDYSMMMRVLTNLIDNSIKYIGDGSFIEVSLSKNDEATIISVKDDGIGIAKEHHEEIFKRFFKVDFSRSSDEAGSMGLGLSMVQQMVHLNNGKIELESDLDNGSCFVVTFNNK